MSVIKESVINSRLGRYINSRNGLPMFVSAANPDVLQSVVHFFGGIEYWVIDEEKDLHNNAQWKINPSGYAFIVEDKNDWTLQVLVALAQCQGDLFFSCTQNEWELVIDAMAHKVFVSTESPEEMCATFGFGPEAVLTFSETSVEYDLLSSDEDSE